MTALKGLLARVEAGEFSRKDEPLLKYTQFYDECRAAGVKPAAIMPAMEALRVGCAQFVLRALIAQEGEA